MDKLDDAEVGCPLSRMWLREAHGFGCAAENPKWSPVLYVTQHVTANKIRIDRLTFTLRGKFKHVKMDNHSERRVRCRTCTKNVQEEHEG